MAKPLTALGIKNLKPTPGVQREIPDAGCPGLRLVVHPTRAKSWIMRFRQPSGKSGKLTLASFDPAGEAATDPKIGCRKGANIDFCANRGVPTGYACSPVELGQFSSTSFP